MRRVGVRSGEAGEYPAESRLCRTGTGDLSCSRELLKKVVKVCSMMKYSVR